MGLELVYILGATLLGAALVWGAIRYRQRSCAQQRAGERATRRLYEQPERIP